MDTAQLLAAHGVGGTAGKRKFKLWELPIEFTHRIAWDYTNASQHLTWFGLNDIKVQQLNSTTSLRIYKNDRLLAQPTVGQLNSQRAHVYIDDNGDIYVFSDVNAKIYTFKASENYAISNESPITGVTSGRVGHVNFRYGNYLFFTAQNSLQMFLYRFDLTSGKAVQSASLLVNYSTNNHCMPYYVSGNLARYVIGSTIYTINLSTMTQSTVTINSYAGHTNQYYMGFYNNTHFINGKNDASGRYVVFEYPAAGGAPTVISELSYGPKLAAKLGVSTEAQYFGNWGIYSVQASDKMICIFPGTYTSYNDQIAYFDMAIKKVVKLVRLINGGSVMPCATVSKTMSVNENNEGQISQFEIDLKYA